VFSRFGKFTKTGISLPFFNPVNCRFFASSSNIGLSRAASKARWLSVRCRRRTFLATTNANGEPHSPA
jgi:hypothetical protein